MTTRFTMNHIGINFPDVDAAVDWYRDVLGCHVLAPPATATQDGSHYGDCVADIFGQGFGAVKIAHLTTMCGVGIEMFEFVQPKTQVPANTFDYARAGIFHFCLTTPDIEATAASIERNGGKILSRLWKLHENGELYLIYCQDPWGTVIEFYSMPYAQAILQKPE